MFSQSLQFADQDSVAAFDPYALPTEAADAGPRSTPITRLIDAYRGLGYRRVRLDPLSRAPLPEVPELRLRFHGLDPAHRRESAGAVLPTATTMQELEWQLKRVYCGSIGLDCSGVRKRQRRTWLYARMEAELTAPPLAPDRKRWLLGRLAAAEMWERLAADRFAHAKRFSLEGCESLVPLLETLFDEAGSCGVRQVFLGLPHRGRLNALVNVMDFDAQDMLDRLDPDSEVAIAQRDLPYHLGGLAKRTTDAGELTLVLAPNPSHLQSVYPVVCGMARGHLDEHPDTPCLPVMVHGDAAFAGQGVVMETLNLTRRSGYTAGGVVHVIVNNQIGFTTPNVMDVRANDYCTDVTRMVDAPVLHVNADDPEAVLRAARIALEYRMEHGADIVIDLLGYRRLGHSEHDLTAVTQPALHAAIASHPTVTEQYHAAVAESTRLVDLREDALRQLLAGSAVATSRAGAAAVVNGTRHRLQPLSLQRLQALTQTLTTLPEGVVLHDRVRDLCECWRAALADGQHTVDWRMAENLAHATLLEDGHGIRLSGMDVGRGTFMHRHAVWHSQATLPGEGRQHVPLQHVAQRQGAFDIVNSPLTEEAALGFEYGYSVQTRTRLTLWEAQFGDFVNGAQVFVDQYIASGEYKWGCQSALTMLLPHGHEGVGPEHSSGFLGRFLQLCADENLRVVVPSTSGQWFHLLREQATLAAPKPLVVMSPKSELHGNGRSHSRAQDLVDGAFMPVLADTGVAEPNAVTRVVLCSGKFFYELLAQREHDARTDVALIRVEQLYPFPAQALMAALAAFPNLREIVWAQEEDVNQGAWRFVRDELEACLPPGRRLASVCRHATPSGAHASVRAHQVEQRRVAAAVFGVFR
ncbi:2-oxoglutarate dehydrogenase E1 component [Ralstonia pseudosolanacearum]|uniref:2-oxoglutarate dehydrogenase E1 component n=1 Tax=Ralstonia pseudosolanacearum TaxID=1310165 RepID=UPI0005C54EDA|nr:2-oxoglutarate dehydrogenase E1 component [Ralstonia pseudosolanacearum]ANH35504.1 2-oxoglutarate dehydrogenase [Ralstonia solanacearum]